jgi:hypothetical protein
MQFNRDINSGHNFRFPFLSLSFKLERYPLEEHNTGVLEMVEGLHKMTNLKYLTTTVHIWMLFDSSYLSSLEEININDVEQIIVLDMDYESSGDDDNGCSYYNLVSRLFELPLECQPWRSLPNLQR